MSACAVCEAAELLKQGRGHDALEAMFALGVLATALGEDMHQAGGANPHPAGKMFCPAHLDFLKQATLKGLAMLERLRS